MKILHCALMLNPVSGIINQMKWEQSAAHELGLKWDVKIFCPFANNSVPGLFYFSKKVRLEKAKNLLDRAIDYVNFRIEYYRWIESCSANYDSILLRYSTSDPFQYFFLRRCKTPVYLVHHTLEIPELRALGGAGANLRIFFEWIFRGASHRESFGFLGVTKEIVDSRPNNGTDRVDNFCRYPNGIQTEDFSVFLERPMPASIDSRDPVLVYVASHFNQWHGLDLLLDNIEESKQSFVLHLVGKLNDRDRLRAAADSRILIHGHLSQSALNEVLLASDVGLSSFALSRNKMSEACPLKTREYLAQGLPVYSGHRDVFPEDCGFYRVGLPQVSLIIDFCRDVAMKTRAEIAEEARPFIEKSNLVDHLYKWLIDRRA